MASLLATKLQLLQVKSICLQSWSQWGSSSSNFMPDLPQCASGQAKVSPLQFVWWDSYCEYLNSTGQVKHLNMLSFRVSSTMLLVRVGAKSARQLGHDLLRFIHSSMHCLHVNLLHLLHSTIPGLATLRQIVHVNAAVNYGLTDWSGSRSLFPFWQSLTCVDSFSIYAGEAWKRDFCLN